MKKYFIYILLLLLPILVNAEVKITNIEVIDHTEGLEVKDPTYKDLKLDLNIKFSEVEEFVKYKVTVKNDTEKDYVIAVNEDFTKGEYIAYEYTFSKEDNIVKANSEESIYIKATYQKEVPSKDFIEGKFIEKNNMILDLANKEKNPNTSVGVYILILLVLSILSISLILLIRNKMNAIPIAIMLFILIPSTIYAIEKLSIEINANIEITEPKEKGFFYMTDKNNVENLKITYEFELGMTFSDWLNSKYNKDNFTFDDITQENRCESVGKRAVYIMNQPLIEYKHHSDEIILNQEYYTELLDIC